MSRTSEVSLQHARDAFQAHEWPRALERFGQADRQQALTAEDLESMADAAWWVARPDEAIETLQRAYTAYLADGKNARAGYVALVLAREHRVKGAASVAAGWFNRATRLLEAEPEGAEHGYLYLHQSFGATQAGNPDQAIAAAERAEELGRRVGDPNLQAIGGVYHGVALIEKGDVADGLGLIDDAALSAVSGELGLYATGTVYCNTIAACCEIADYARARDWAEAARRWSASHPFQPVIPGDCRVHEAEVLALRGLWAEAEESARRGAEELRAFNRMYHVGEALYQVGDVRMHLGDLKDARDLFTQASELGRQPYPGLALLLLREGKPEGAMASIHRAVEEETTSKLSRARLLPAFVEIALATGQREAAADAVEDLESIAETYGARTLRAAADAARGAVLLARGNDMDAARALRRAVTGWQEVEAPYEVARARTLLADAAERHGDYEGAAMELQAARAAFAKLGAQPDVERVDARLARGESARPVSARDEKTFLFTDIVKSTNLVEAIGDEAWLDVVAWHDQTLRSLFAAEHGEEIDHAGDGFFVVFDTPDAAIRCATAIQRTLAEHRRSHGFAPQVRIGAHTARASRSGTSYRGKGVHEAARIAAQAEGGEIVASRITVDALSPSVGGSNLRTVTLKGISQPVEIVTIDWR